MGCLHAEKAVDFVSSRSCRAGTPFRYTTKGGKGVPKGEENRSVRFSSPLGTPHLSTDRASPPHGKRAGAYVIEEEKEVPATLALEPLMSREQFFVFDCVRFLAADALRAFARRPDCDYISGHSPPGAARRLRAASARCLMFSRVKRQFPRSWEI